MSAGIQLRMSRLFNSTTGKSVIVAVDHGIEGFPMGLRVPWRRFLRLSTPASMLS